MNLRVYSSWNGMLTLQHWLVTFFHHNFDRKKKFYFVIRFCNWYNAGNISGTRTATLPYSWVHSRFLVEQELLPFVQLSSFPFFSGIHVASLVFCGSLFVFTSFLFCPLCRLFCSDLRLLITFFTIIKHFVKRTKRRDTRKGHEKL